MAFLKFLKGDSSRIDTSATPFQEGNVYFTPDNGGIYIDSIENGAQKRIRIISSGSDGNAITSVEKTLSASGWISGKQKINVDVITAGNDGIVGVSQTATTEQKTACGKAGLYICEQGDGYITIAADGTTPTSDIPVTIFIFG